MNDYKLWTRNSLIIKLYNDITGNNIDHIISSAPRQLLKCFGGNLNIDEYRKKTNHVLYYSSRYIIPPIIPVKTLIEESYKDRNKYKWETKLNISKYNNLKKNIVKIDNENNTIEKIMGIKKIKL